MKQETKQRLSSVLSVAKFTFRWGFIPVVLYLGKQIFLLEYTKTISPKPRRCLLKWKNGFGLRSFGPVWFVLTASIYIPVYFYVFHVFTIFLELLTALWIAVAKLLWRNHSSALQKKYENSQIVQLTCSFKSYSASAVCSIHNQHLIPSRLIINYNKASKFQTESKNHWAQPLSVCVIGCFGW